MWDFSPSCVCFIFLSLTHTYNSNTISRIAHLYKNIPSWHIINLTFNIMTMTHLKGCWVFCIKSHKFIVNRHYFPGLQLTDAYLQNYEICEVYPRTYSLWHTCRHAHIIAIKTVLFCNFIFFILFSEIEQKILHVTFIRAHQTNSCSYCTYVCVY